MASNGPINTSKKQISLKLVGDTEGQRVVFAEARNDFVDFLFNISYLPFGTVMKLLAEQRAMEGCIGNIYKSIKDNGNSIKHPSRQKDGPLKPKVVTINASDPQELLNIQTTASTFCQCYGCSLSLDVANPGSHVKRNLTFLVMDDLLVMPVSAVCVISMLNGYQIKNIGTLETREVYLGMDEALHLLKGSMHSKTLLTDAYLRNQDEQLEWLENFSSL